MRKRSNIKGMGAGLSRSPDRAKRRSILRNKIEMRIARKLDDVFLTREFTDLADKGRVQRVLRSLVKDGRLIRLGYGVYGRAMISTLSGKPMLASAAGFTGVVRQALNKLGVTWQPTEAERAYNERRSTQVPINPVLRVKGRFSRRLRHRNLELVIERIR